MMMMMKDFILEESPWPKDEVEGRAVHEIINILDEITMDPLERELIKYKLGNELRGGKTLTYRADLVRDFVEFYGNSTNPFVIELIGMSNLGLDIIAKAFLENLNESFVCKLYLDFKSTTRGGYKMAIVGISRKVGVEKKLIPIIDRRLEFLEENGATLIIEYIGEETKKDGLYTLFMVYDRHHNKHGYVALKV